ncbi:hypothetical protein [Pseudomonas aeruginosa]|uniref:hypothetical protein n=1 Tax=Pseudomonas aeruginosa TaxID=287 RepID=UPI001D09D735|nr:hypothetical protein [Pseudomonas aeruginosa]MCC0321287.1 hypothetical protein [Pseudomonas aeruginosa]
MNREDVAIDVTIQEKHPEQAGGDERAAFEVWASPLGWKLSPDQNNCGIVVAERYGHPGVQRCWEAWQARAALAQPSPVRSSLLINGYQLRAALDFIAPDGTAEQLESEACIEWRQQDADFLEAGLYAFCAEYPEEGSVLLDEEPTTAQPSPLQAEQAEAERPELWAVHAQGPDELYAAFSREDAEKHAAELNALPMPEGIAVGAVVVPSPWPAVQHWQYLAEQEQDHKNEIAGRLRQLERICEGLPQDAIDGGWTVQGIRGYAKRLEDQLKAALARVAELTATRNRYGVDAHYFNKNLQRILRDFESFTTDELARSLIILAKVADEKVVAQAQHSVPEGFRELLEMLVASDLRKIRYAGAWRREVHDRASSILALLAAAPGKEGV